MKNVPERIIRRVLPAGIILGLLLCATVGQAEIQRWRVGDKEHPWVLAPVSGRSHWGQGWAVEISAESARRLMKSIEVALESGEESHAVDLTAGGPGETVVVR